MYKLFEYGLTHLNKQLNEMKELVSGYWDLGMSKSEKCMEESINPSKSHTHYLTEIKLKSKIKEQM